MKNAEHKGVQNAELRIVGAIHESPENKQIFGCKKTTGRGVVIFAKQIHHGAKRSLLGCSRKQTVIVCNDGRFVNRPYEEIFKFTVGRCLGAAEKQTNFCVLPLTGRGALWCPEHKRLSQNNQSACHPERRKTLAFFVVEVLRVEPWRTSRTEEQTRRRDLVTSLGGLLRQM